MARHGPKQRRRDAAIAGVAFALMLIVALLYNWPEPRVQNLKFAWEYGNTAASLVTGEGYANPFEGIRSGPTAWMPPLYVGLIAAVFALLGVKSVAALWVLLALKYAGLAGALLLLLRAADGSTRSRDRWLLVPAFAGAICANRATFFWALHDSWLIILGTCLVLHNFAVRRRGPSRGNDAVLLALAVALPLTSPALAGAFVALQLFEVWLDRRSGSTRAAPGALGSSTRRMVVGTAFLVATAAWGFRNLQALELFIPVKSNLWFDFYQANRLDDDGLVTNATFLAYNPANPNRYQLEYAELGEGRFTRRYRRRAAEVVRDDSGEWLRRVARRAASAFLYLHDPDDAKPVRVAGIAAADRQKLLEAGLLGVDWREDLVWLSLGLTPEDFAARSAPLALERGPQIRDDWREARAAVQAQRCHWSIVGRSLVVSTLPTLGLVFGLCHARTRRDPYFAGAALLYLAILLPYVLVSHYLRYQTALIGLQAVFSFYLGAGLLAVARRRRSTA